MESQERISEAEHAVMEALWARAPLGATEVAEAVGDTRGWSLPTVKTLLSRLLAKRAIEARPDGKRFLYSPLLARSDYLRGESRRLVDRLFSGSAAGLVAQLVEAEALSADDLAEIDAILAKLRA